MTGETTSPAERPRHPWLAYSIYALCATAFLFPFLRTAALGSDEGILLSGAARILHGDVFARDFVEVMGPGTFYVLAAFFKLFGVSFLVARIYLFLSLLGSGLAIYYLSRQVCGRYSLVPSIVLAATYFGMFGQGVSYHVDSNLLASMSLCCLFLWKSRPRTYLLILCGLFAGATTCVLQPKGGLLLLAILAWFALQRKRYASPLRSMALVLAAYTAVVAGMIGYFWSQGALRSLIYVDFYFPYQHYSGVNEVSYAYGVQEFWSTWARLGSGAIWADVMASAFLLPFLLIAALPPLLILYGIFYRKVAFEPTLSLLWLTGSACWLSEIHRRDTYHLVYGSPFLLLLCVHFMGLAPRKFPSLALRVVTICSIGLAAFNWLMLTAVPRNSFTRAGSVRLFESDDALQFLIRHTRPGEEIFVYPDAPMYYFLSATTNRTPYSLLTYNFYLPQQFENAIKILDQDKVQYIVWDNGFLAKASKSSLPGSQPADPKDLLMENYLRSHYTAVAQFDSTLILQRSPETR
jgi:hypothetical protein